MTFRDRFVRESIRRAFATGPYTGKIPVPRVCMRDWGHGGLIARVIFTVDCGHHSGGWWKNPDYEYCRHLSLAFRDEESGEFAPQHKGHAREWCAAFFGESVRLIWAEPPFSDGGKAADAWHYRLFTAADFCTPILPRGEVYSRQFTEIGWKSFSEIYGDDHG